MITGVTNQGGAGWYKKTSNVQRNNGESFATMNNKLQEDAILSTLHLETGESIGIYYSENSTSSNPIMMARIINSTGEVREMEINPENVDPYNASYVEMVALSAHLKQQGKIDGPAGAIATMVFNARVKEANANNISEKCNFVSEMQGALRDMMKNGLMDTYLKYLKEVTIYSEWNK